MANGVLQSRESPASRRSLEPLDILEFRRVIRRFALIQLFAMTFLLSIYGWACRAEMLDLEMLALTSLVLTEVIVSFFLFRRRVFQARLLDIYPRRPESNKYLCAVILALPITFIPFLAFLLLKGRSDREDIPLIFKKPGWFTLGIVAAAAWFPVCSFIRTSSYATNGNYRPPLGERVVYYTADPVTYYVVSLGNEVSSLMELKEKFQSEPNPEKVIEAIKDHAKQRELSSTGMILALSIDVMFRLKASGPDRSVAGKRPFEQRIGVLQDGVTIVEMWDHGEPDAFRNNPISFANPLGVLEISLLSWEQALLEVHFDNIFMVQMEKALKVIEADDASRTPEQTQVLRELKARLAGLPSFKKYQSLKSSLFWRLLSQRQSRGTTGRDG